MKKIITSSILFFVFTTAVYADQQLEAETVEILQDIENSLPEGCTLMYEEMETSSTPFSSKVTLKNPSLFEENAPAPLVRHTGVVMIGKNNREKAVWIQTTGSTEVSYGAPAKAFAINSPIEVIVDLHEMEEDSSDLLESILSSTKNVRVGFGKGSMKTTDGAELTFDDMLFSLEEMGRSEMKVDYNVETGFKNLNLPKQTLKWLESVFPEEPALAFYPDEHGMINSFIKGKIGVPTMHAYDKLEKLYQEGGEIFFKEVIKLGYGLDFNLLYSDDLQASETRYLINSDKSRVRVLFDTNFTPSEKYNELLKKSVEFIQKRLNAPNTEDLPFREKVTHFLKKNENKIKELFPGTISAEKAHATIDVSAEWKEGLMPEKVTFLYDLHFLESHTGIKIEGFGSDIVDQFPNQGKISITIRDYNKSVDKLASLYNLFAVMYQDTFPGEPVYILTPEDVALAKKVLRYLSNNPDGKDLEITIEEKSPSSINIGNKTLDEALFGLGQLLIPQE